MKSILSTILIVSLALSFGLGSGGFARSESAQASSSEQVVHGFSMAVSAQPSMQPELVLAQSVTQCIGVGSLTGNLIQTAGALNLNQFADCFTISLGEAPKLPSLALAEAAPQPELVVAYGPTWSPNQVTESGQPQTAPVIILNMALAVLLFGAIKVTKRAATIAHRTITIPTSLTLSQLQVYRC